MKLHPKIIELLTKRGIQSDDDIKEFFSEKPQRTYDPFLLADMEAGVDLLLSAIEDDRTICIYGDYDVDGITSTVILWEVLSLLTENLTYYIPSRFDEGYGLNKEAVRRIAESGVGVILTVDNGSTSLEEIELAGELGMDVLVTDHHNIADRRPNCLTINPKRPDSKYPFHELAGCGVAFKLAQALVDVTGLPKETTTRLLDLAAIGTVADIVPLIDENRTIVKYGLQLIHIGNRENLKALFEKSAIDIGKANTRDIGFAIAPRLNAAGRIEHASIGVNMFLSEDSSEAEKGAEELEKLNQERRDIQEGIFGKCVSLADERYSDAHFLLLSVDDAHEGVAGIVAGKIKDLYYKPTVILTKSDKGLVKGTGRSIAELNIYQLLSGMSDLFIKFGGHAAACGLTMRVEDIPELRRRIGKIVDEIYRQNPYLFTKKIIPDVIFEDGELTPEFVEQLMLFEPFGKGNEKPMIGINVRSVMKRRIGNDGQYLKLRVKDNSGVMIDCVKFSDVDEADALIGDMPGTPLSIIGAVEFNEWNGKRYIQIVADDIRPEYDFGQVENT